MQVKIKTTRHRSTYIRKEGPTTHRTPNYTPFMWTQGAQQSKHNVKQDTQAHQHARLHTVQFKLNITTHINKDYQDTQNQQKQTAKLHKVKFQMQAKLKHQTKNHKYDTQKQAQQTQAKGKQRTIQVKVKSTHTIQNKSKNNTPDYIQFSSN